jgi:hypothetical protein
VFVVAAFNSTEASVIPRTALKFAAKCSSPNYTNVVSVFNPAHYKQSLVAKGPGTNALSQIIHNFVAHKIKVCGLTWSESYGVDQKITVHPLVWASHWQPRRALKYLRESFDDGGWRAANIYDEELALQRQSYGEQFRGRMIRLSRMMSDDIPDAQLRTLSKNECFSRRFIRTSQIANLNDSNGAKYACENCKDECIKRYGIVSRPVPEYFQRIVAGGRLIGLFGTFALLWGLGWLR